MLAALCAHVHACSNNTNTEQGEATVAFATILHSIDINSCYTWLTQMDRHSFHRMVNGLIAQCWKFVWLGTFSLYFHDKILFKYALLSKLMIAILAPLACNAKIATILSYWPIGLAMVHCFVLLNLIKKRWKKYYIAFLSMFIISYVVQKCDQLLRKKTIDNQHPTRNVSYLFDFLLGFACSTVISYVLSNIYVVWFFVLFPFGILLPEYFGAISSFVYQ